MAGPYVAQVARSTPFDNSTNGFPSDNTDVQTAIENIKAGKKIVANFSGNPKKATVTFTQAFPDANYSVVISANLDGRDFTAESLTTTGFVINTNANANITGDIYWHAIRFQG